MKNTSLTISIEAALDRRSPIVVNGEDAKTGIELLRFFNCEHAGIVAVSADGLARWLDQQEASQGLDLAAIGKRVASVRRIMQRSGYAGIADSAVLSNHGLGLTARSPVTPVDEEQINHFRFISPQCPAFEVVLDLEMWMGLTPEAVLSATYSTFKQWRKDLWRQKIRVLDGFDRPRNVWLNNTADDALVTAMKLTKAEGGLMPLTHSKRTPRTLLTLQRDLKVYRARCERAGIGPGSAHCEFVRFLMSEYASCLPNHTEYQQFAEVSVDVGFRGGRTQWLKAKYFDQATLEALHAENAFARSFLQNMESNDSLARVDGG